MTYNEYWQIIEADVKPEDLVVFKYEDQSVATLEDGLYVLEDKLKDPAFVDIMAKFVKASMKGWDDARANPADTSAPEGVLNMMALLGGSAPVTELPATMPDDTAVILYTSGTTGRPKGAELTHFHLFYKCRWLSGRYLLLCSEI